MAYLVGGQSILTATIVGRHENQMVMSLFHYRYNSNSPLPDGQAALQAFHVEFAGALKVWQRWRACVSEKVVSLRLRYQWTHTTRFAYLEFVPGIGTTGAIPGDAMPVNCAASVTKRTDAAGRSQVGTLHMPGVPATGVVNGQLTAAQFNLYATLADEMLVPINTAAPAAEYLPVLLKTSSPNVSPRFLACTVQDYARVMRRRTVGVGA